MSGSDAGSVSGPRHPAANRISHARGSERRAPGTHWTRDGLGAGDKNPSLAALWLVWALVAFVALNVYAPREESVTRAAALPPPGWAAVLTLLRDDIDTRRYYAYANAMLGRSYDRFFVHASQDDVADHALVTPDRPLIPWRDFAVEYPPGVIVAALPPALITDEFRSYHFLFGLEMEFLLTGAAWLGVKSAERLDPGAGRKTLILSIVYLIALGVIGARRYDALVALTIAAAVYGLVARKPSLAGFAFALSMIAKAAPALIAPIGAWGLWLERPRAFGRAAAAAATTLVVGLAGYAALAGGHALDALAYHSARPLQIESPYGAALMIANAFKPGLIRVEYGFGSLNIVASFEPALRTFATVLTIVALIAVYALYLRNAARIGDQASRLNFTLAAASAALIAFIGLGKVFSPQYMTWLLPLAVIPAALGGELSPILLVSAAAATQAEYPFGFYLASIYGLPMLGVARAHSRCARDRRRHISHPRFFTRNASMTNSIALGVFFGNSRECAARIGAKSRRQS